VNEGRDFYVLQDQTRGDLRAVVRRGDTFVLFSAFHGDGVRFGGGDSGSRRAFDVYIRGDTAYEDLCFAHTRHTQTRVPQMGEKPRDEKSEKAAEQMTVV
jgi:hypothetical protein